MPAISPDESPVMLSALQHYLFCPRQCALIHVEGVWSENFLTAAGRQLHERVDRRGGETRRDVHLATALRLTSLRLGLTGVADMVESIGGKHRRTNVGELWRRGCPGAADIGDRSR